MKFYFRPFLGLTVFTVISVIILIGLGNWQYDRLQWKTALLAEVEAAVTSPPLTSLAAINQAIDQGQPVDFRRAEFTAEILPAQIPFLVYSRRKQALSWRAYYAASDGDARVFLATGLIPDSGRENLTQSAPTAPQAFAGYVRLARGRERGAAPSAPESNRWFSFEPLPETASWAAGQGGQFAAALIETRYYIDTVPNMTAAKDLPIKRPEIRNNHFDYMLTWYSLALILLVIYVILHVQRGRLGFKNNG